MQGIGELTFLFGRFLKNKVTFKEERDDAARDDWADWKLQIVNFATYMTKTWSCHRSVIDSNIPSTTMGSEAYNQQLTRY